MPPFEYARQQHDNIHGQRLRRLMTCIAAGVMALSLLQTRACLGSTTTCTLVCGNADRFRGLPAFTNNLVARAYIQQRGPICRLSDNITPKLHKITFLSAQAVVRSVKPS